MNCISIGAVIALAIGCLILGGCIGALIIYKYEEKTLKKMFDQCEQLEEANRALIAERDECMKTREMFDIIDDVPEYLRDKYDIYERKLRGNFTDNDEDYTEIYV